MSQEPEGLSEREQIARIIDPEAWEERAQRIALSGDWLGRDPEQYGEATRKFMSARRREEADECIEPSLAKADAILALRPPLEGGEGQGSYSTDIAAAGPSACAATEAQRKSEGGAP